MPNESQKEEEDVTTGENERDEADIIGNQDETDSGAPNRDDRVMGAGPTDTLAPSVEPADFVRGEVDLVQQMDRAERAYGYPNRAASHPPDHLKTQPEDVRS